MIAILYIFKFHLKIIYFFIKLFSKQKNRVFFLSRQTNKPSINYQLLIDYISEHDSSIEIKVSCRRVSENLNKVIHSKNKSILKNIPKIMNELGGCIGYYFTLYKQMYYIATSKVVITDGYNVLISCLKHKKNTCVIQMWHALAAIKKFGYQNVGSVDGMNSKTAKVLNMHENYDYVLSGSEAMNKAFSEAFNTDIKKVLSIGTPYVDYLLNLKVNKNDICKEIGIKDLKKRIILYVPTFRKDGRNGIDEIINNIDFKKYTLVISMHDIDKSKTKEYENVILNPKIPTPLLLKIADFVISDYSAVIVEAAILKKNIFLYLFDYEKYMKETGLNVDLFKELPNCSYKKIKPLLKEIQNNNYNKKEMLAFRNKFVTNLTNDSTKKVYDVIKGELE